MGGHDISGQLRSRRLKMGLSLSQLARKVNTSAAAISRYENGWQRFEVCTLRKLATALECRLRVELEPLEAVRPGDKAAGGLRSLRRLFWDRRLRARDLRDYPLWVIERVLDYGSLEDVRFLAGRVGREKLLEAAAQARFSSAKTENFWKSILQREDVACTKRFSRKPARTCWPG